MHADLLEPVRPIRALLRGLEALRALNARDGLTVTEVADMARLPRTTAYRILETLRQGGFVVRDDMDDRYRPTMAVRGLAEGAQTESWIHEGAWPILAKLGAGLLWPLGLWTLAGDAMVLRAATDRTSPLALNRLSAGDKVNLYASAPGLALLAFESPEQCRLIAEITGSEAKFAKVASKLEKVRTQGYAFDVFPSGGEITMGVPLIGQNGGLLGALSVRFIRSALTDQRAIDELLPKLQQTAEKIVALTAAPQDLPMKGRSHDGVRVSF